jgi:uncharacterized protein YqjF (DUF2071 family)
MRCADLDRTTSLRRPEGPAAGTQRWRELLFLHWSFEVDLIRPLVPAGIELDTWDARAWVGLVPFRMNEIRSAWMPRFAALDFLETNLRTYVHRDGEPGVWFFSLEASSWLAVQVARKAWSLPYFHAEMSSDRAITGGGGLRYLSKRKEGRATLDARWTIGDPLGPSKEGSAEFFFLERYLLFSERKGTLRKGQVHHQPYPARAATLEACEESLLAAAGIDRGGRPPELVHYAEGVDVEVFGPWDLGGLR